MLSIRNDITLGKQREAELAAVTRQLHDANTQLDTALANMTQGLAMFDGEQRLVLCNAQYFELFDLPPAFGVPGTPLVELVRQSVACLGGDSSDLETRIAQRLEQARVREPWSSNVELEDGRVTNIADGFSETWSHAVSIEEDITERKRAETVRVRARRHGDGGVEISVKDDGIGVADKHLAVVFEPFRQVDSALSRRFEGTGLGLPLAKKMVELHDGTLRFDSKLGVGTTVTQIFPADRVIDLADAAQ